MRTFSNPLLSVLLALFAAVATAEVEHQHGDERPAFSVSQTVTVQALVESIDRDTREVELLTSQGETIDFVAGPEVRNFAQLDVGDIITAEYVESLRIEVFGDPHAMREDAEVSSRTTAELGEKPGMTAVDTVVSYATVEAIDLEARTFKLRDADGEVREYLSAHPQYLELANVGDRVATTVRNSIAISVTEAEQDE